MLSNLHAARACLHSPAGAVLGMPAPTLNAAGRARLAGLPLELHAAAEAAALPLLGLLAADSVAWALPRRPTVIELHGSMFDWHTPR